MKLPSWNDGEVKSAVVAFVERVCDRRSAFFVPAEQRIATFDNDGTLWCEQPIQVQVFFLIDRVKQLAAHNPSLAARQPFKALLERDLATLRALGKQALFELFFATHAGISVEEFDQLARAWFASARHPTLGRRFDELTYQPQRELLDYLREHAFKPFIVSGGGVDFIRAFAEHAYGIPPEQVIGSSGKLRFEAHEGRAELMKIAELGSFDDRDVKPQNIGLHIGRRPLLAFGNSDGDLAMLRYTIAGTGPRLALLLHHDDAEREVAYDRDFALSPLADALDNAAAYGIKVVSMKRDWRAVFSTAGAEPLRRAVAR